MREYPYSRTITSRGASNFSSRAGMIYPNWPTCFKNPPKGISRVFGKRLKRRKNSQLDEVRRSVVNVILAAAPGGGFVLSTGGSIHDANCYDNVMTFIETAHAFGSYPIDAARLEAELRRYS